MKLIGSNGEHHGGVALDAVKQGPPGWLLVRVPKTGNISAVRASSVSAVVNITTPDGVVIAGQCAMLSLGAPPIAVESSVTAVAEALEHARKLEKSVDPMYETFAKISPVMLRSMGLA